MVVDTVVVGDDVGVAVGIDREALDLVEDEAVGAQKVGDEIADDRLVDDRKVGADRGRRHVGERDVGELLDLRLLADLVVALDDDEAVIADRGQLGQPDPAGLRRLERVVDRRPGFGRRRRGS